MTRLPVHAIYQVYPPIGREYNMAKALAMKYRCRRVVDAGCARGNLYHTLKPVLYVGMDIKLYRFRGTHSPNALYILADARYPPLNTRSNLFDCAFFVNSIFYIGVDALKEYTNIAKYIIIIDINPRNPFIKLASSIEGIERLPPERLAEILKNIGFAVIEVGGYSTYYIVATSELRPVEGRRLAPSI